MSMFCMTPSRVKFREVDVSASLARTDQKTGQMPHWQPLINRGWHQKTSLAVYRVEVADC
jgi:hypothetical protein